MRSVCLLLGVVLGVLVLAAPPGAAAVDVCAPVRVGDAD